MDAQTALNFLLSAGKQKIPPNHAKILLYLKINPGAFQKSMVIDGLMSTCVMSNCMAILIAKGWVIQSGPYLNKQHKLGPSGEVAAEKLLNPPVSRNDL